MAFVQGTDLPSLCDMRTYGNLGKDNWQTLHHDLSHRVSFGTASAL